MHIMCVVHYTGAERPVWGCLNPMGTGNLAYRPTFMTQLAVGEATTEKVGSGNHPAESRGINLDVFALLHLDYIGDARAIAKVELMVKPPPRRFVCHGIDHSPEARLC
jgi:hypothetical protein